MFCAFCGAQNPDNVEFCAGCGQSLNRRSESPPPAQNDLPDPGYPPGSGVQTGSVYPPTGYQPGAGYQPHLPGGSGVIDQNEKTMAIMAYFIFFIPLLATPESRFGRYHANQGLILFVDGIAVSILYFILFAVLVRGDFPLLFWVIISITFGLICIWFAVLAILGVVNAAQGRANPLPLIGSLFTLIKY